MTFLKSNRSFRYLLLFSITLLSINQFFQLILIDLSKVTHNQAVVLGNAMTLLTISKICVLPISGYVVDIFKERRVLLFSSFGFVCFFLFIYFFESSNYLMAYAIISGALLGLVQPPMYSVVPKIVKGDKKTEANSLFQTASQLSQFIVPTIAAFLIGTLSRSLYLGGIVFLGVLCIFLSNAIQFDDVSPEQKTQDKNASPLRDLLKNRSVIVLLVITALINFATSGPLQVTLPVFMSNNLSFTTSTYGYILSIYGLGTFIGSFCALFLKERFETLSTLIILATLFGISWMASLSFNSLYIIGFLFLISGFLIGLINVLFMSLLQEKTPINLMGRVTSIQFLFSSVLSPVSFYAMGKLTSQFSPSLIFMGTGIVVIAIMAVLFLLRKKSID